MKFPHVRFTVRRTMVAVAVVAVWLSVLYRWRGHSGVGRCWNLQGVI